MEHIYRTADVPWKLGDGWGNHRVVVEVPDSCACACAEIHWRRRDLSPERVGIRVMHLPSREEIHQIQIREITRERGRIAFAAPWPGLYAIYYLPFVIEGPTWYFPTTVYRKPDEADPNLFAGVPEVRSRVVAIESRTDFDGFYPMEVPATRAETDEVLARHAAGMPFLTYTESREHPIRMFREIPHRWLSQTPGAGFAAEARPHEYYCFQIAIWARRALPQVSVRFDACAGLSRDALTCFNMGGADWLGRPFTREITLAEGEIRPLWLGVDIAPDASGELRFDVVIAGGGHEARIPVRLDIRGEALADRGDGDPARLTRLRWLNSGIGLNEDVTAPYTPLELEGMRVRMLGRGLEIGANGLPARIFSRYDVTGERLRGDETHILAEPMAFEVTCGGKVVPFDFAAQPPRAAGEGAADILSRAQTAALRYEARARVEYDGHIDTVITLTALEDIEMDDARLRVAFAPGIARYAVGMGTEGGTFERGWQYRWDIDRANNMVWLGSAHAGLHVKLKHTQDVWELYNYRKMGLPEGWHNGGLGACDILRDARGDACVCAGSGAFALARGESRSFRFSLLITPLRPLDSDANWRDRYYQVDEGIPSLEHAKSQSATVVNLHQGGPLNPYINYPFLTVPGLREQADAAHAQGMRYKLYYTVRELTNYAAELHVLRALGDEVLMDGPFFQVADHFSESRHSLMSGGPWLCEHLVEGFVPAWQALLWDGEYDSALAMIGLSRWHNYYLQGLRFLIEHAHADGLYLDGVGYDRQIMKRVRKTMNAARPGCLIDFHSGNNYEPQYGLGNPIAQYLELMPSVDSLWLGEGYDYEKKGPDYWLVEISGIPFGLMGEMLQGGGNRWRGMLFGMTPRFGWVKGADPLPVWRLWDEFGMEGTRMIGWWTGQCPVETGRERVLATAYVKPGKCLIAIASWAEQTERVTPRFDWAALGMTVAARMYLPEIEGFQRAQCYAEGEALEVAPARGCIVILER